ncbi:YybH family protein [Streptomyces antimicrobicus]|uniref:Nuclear transport factor 2 family protein n=1 Tax=Streptomyces antimicrobicus TaxID=2883108 RepID=A0ABS8B4L9_9ACTN|nr:nuclear transport factor 2 family protein [Streptomyces antimicrobicus]MCB5179554.1 nuclear transport factor 2 family protein [Streptomyces antimicrobicus]
MATEFGVLADLLGAWRAAFDERRVDDIVALFAEDALFQGLSPALLEGSAQIRTYYENVPAGMRAEVEVLRSRTLGPEAVAGFAAVTFRPRTGDPQPVRLSVVAQHLGTGWRIRAYHVSRTA